MDEFALGYETKSSFQGQTHNAFKSGYYPGGSSGGTAVAVAAGYSLLGIGSDTGGSIRIPASFNNLLGLRPTFGLISTTGLVPLSHSRDTVGPMSRSMHWLARGLDVMIDESNRRKLLRPVFLKLGTDKIKFENCLAKGILSKVRIGVLRSLFPSPGGKIPSREVQQINSGLNAALEKIKLEGRANVIDVDIISKKSLSKYKSSSFFEFHADLETYLQRRKSISPDSNIPLPGSLQDVIDRIPEKYLSIKKRLQAKEDFSLSHSLSSTLYKKSVESYPIKVANNLFGDMKKHNLDVLAYPTFTRLPAKIGKRNQPFCANNRLAAMTGTPALTIPAAWSTSPANLPIGLEILGLPYSECLLIAIGNEINSLLNMGRPFREQ